MRGGAAAKKRKVTIADLSVKTTDNQQVTAVFNYNFDPEAF